MTEPVYSKRYARVQVFADELTARVYARQAFPHVGAGAIVVKVEGDGSYLYRADQDGFATSSPLAGFGVAATESRRLVSELVRLSHRLDGTPVRVR